MNAWHRVLVEADWQRRVDPHFDWARATGFRFFFQAHAPRRFPVVIELNGITAREFARLDWPAPRDWAALAEVPALYRRPPPGLENFAFCTATVSEAFFDRLANDPLRQVIRRVELSLPLEEYGVSRVLPLGGPPAQPGEVVTGVIDDGIAFAHRRFRLADNRTRVAFFWNQDAPAGGPVAYGRELTKLGVGDRAIDFVMANATHAGLVDEDEVYRITQHINQPDPAHKPVSWRIAHGTHVLDLAAGHDPATAPGTRPIIGVQLPVHATADTSGGDFGRYAIDGMYYILSRAEQIGAQVPVVVNISYGFIAGPHDGSSLVEAALDQMIALRPGLAIVIPAGNSHLSRCHSRFRLRRGGRQLLRWRVQPDDRTPSYMQMWLPHANAAGVTARVRLRIRPPGSAWSPWVNEGETWRSEPVPGQVLCNIVYHNVIAPGRDRNMVFIGIAPTATLQANQLTAPSGVWQIEIQNQGRTAVIDAWIQRDDTLYGYPESGRQSYFDDPVYVRFDAAGREVETDNASFVQRRGSLSSIATGQRTVVIGGFHRKDWRQAKYTASGPVIHPPGRGVPAADGPDAMAVSEDSWAHQGVLAAGSRSGSCVAMYGTSVAAPQITRWIAERMAAGQPFDRNAVFQFAQGGVAPGYATEANPPPSARPQAPVARRGGGRIEAPPVVDRLIER